MKTQRKRSKLRWKKVKFRFASLYMFAIALTTPRAFASDVTKSECIAAVSKLLGPTPDEKWLLANNRGDFFELPPVAPSVAESHNATALRLLDQSEASTESDRVHRLSREELKNLLDYMKNNPQVKESASCGAYKGSPVYGFCWGRAFAVHLAAQYSRIPFADIRKLWVVGNLGKGDTKWRYHVATAVRDKDGVWQALDPIFDFMSVDDWYNKMKYDFDRDGTMRLFISPPSRHGPDSTHIYNKRSLVNDASVNGFFVDVVDGLRKDMLHVGEWPLAHPDEAAAIGASAHDAGIGAAFTRSLSSIIHTLNPFEKPLDN